MTVTEIEMRNTQIQKCSSTARPRFDAILVGASISGMWTLHLLKQQGLRVLLIDACADVGGSWQYHRYPGCGVDAEVPFYEFSDPRLWSEWRWSEKFPRQPEIQRYLAFVCEKLELRPHLQLETRVSAAHWNDERQVWCIFYGDNQVADCHYFISCTGYATIPHIPDLSGRESFGRAFHTSQWPRDLDYEGKRVGVIGTGASGVQCIEAIAPKVGRLVVFQRTPNMATPKRQETFTAHDCREMKLQYPTLFARRRSRTGYPVTHTTRMSDHSAAERCRVWERLWQQGGSAPWRDNYTDLLNDKCASDAFYEFWLSKTRGRINDVQTADILAPRTPPYAFGTRRPALETQYFEVFNQSHVDLIDIKDDPITGICVDGVRTRKGFFELDILVFATGFDFITRSMLAIDVRGRDGQPLADCWDVTVDGHGVSTFLGLMTKGFPNMFFTMGPQAPTALAFTPHMAEIQGQWISDFICSLRKRGFDVVEPTEEAESWWRDELTRVSDDTLFPTTNSWYMGQNIPNRKQQPLCYFGGVDRYIRILECNQLQAYAGFKFA